MSKDNKQKKEKFLQGQSVFAQFFRGLFFGNPGKVK